MNKKIIFLGGVGDKDTFGGEPTKNKHIIQALEKRGYTVKVVDTYQSRKKFWKLFKLPLFLLFNINSPLIISTSLGNIYWLIKLLCHIKSKRPIYYWGIGGLFPTQIEDGVFDKQYFSIFKTIFVEGHKMKDLLNSLGIHQVVVVPNFKQINYLPDISKKKTNKTIRFVFLSRIHPNKGVSLILDSVQILNNMGLDKKYTVDFYGIVDPAYKKEFQSLSERNENVFYRGSLNLLNNTGYDTLSEYDVMLFPTFWHGEGFPGVVIDAYIAGLPIIASNWNFNEEFVIDNETGIIINDKDIESLVTAMYTIITGKINIEVMAANCQKRALHYNAETVLNDNLFSYLNI